MALQTFVCANSQLLSLAKFSPKFWDHRLPSLQNSLKTSLHLQASKASKESHNRPLSDFPPIIWNDLVILTSNSSPDAQQKQIEELKEKGKGMLMASTNDPAQKVILIDSICRLGFSYHFETEIDEQLNHIFESQPILDENDYDLYTVALIFRVFRQHGYKVSCDVFNKFKDSDGKFKEVLTSDARGMLSLYEATYLRLHGEDILEDACAFAKAHLSSLADKSILHVAEQIISSLALPSHKGIPRLETRKYISFYEQDATESRNETLLKFAKLDFNRVQLLHKQELSYLKSWWEDLNLASKLPYARDRIVELYFVMCAVYFQPCYSRARLILSKFVMLLTVIDDTFDSYGTLEELQQFTEATQRWETSSLDELPDYMKLIYSCWLNLFDEMDEEMSKEGRSYSVAYAKKALHETVKSYLLEIQWLHEGYVAPFEEYLRNAIVTGGAFSITTAVLVGMGEIADIEAFEWLHSKPKILEAAYIIGRLINDIVPNQSGEQRSKHVTNGVECYMKQYGCSREETVEIFTKMFENAWTDMNEECMKPTSVSIHLLFPIVNLARIVEVTYQGSTDGFTNPDARFISYITALFLDQIPI